MSPRAARLVTTLGLLPHPEGGHYREIFRSPRTVQPADGRGERAALTVIHFLLTEGEVSRWHRVASDEAWHVVEGDPLALLVADDTFATVETHRLGAETDGGPAHVVPAGAWQAARSLGAYTLVGCTVGPGFDFADFELIDARPDLAEAARQRPEAAPFA